MVGETAQQKEQRFMTGEKLGKVIPLNDSGLRYMPPSAFAESSDSRPTWISAWGSSDRRVYPKI
jgi:hypothetical protein